MIPSYLISQAYNRNVMQDHPVLYLPNFGPRPSGAASDQAVDQSGNGNNGTFSGGYTLGQPGPYAGTRAVVFDGSSGSCGFGSGSYLAKWTVAAWVNPTSLSGYGIVIIRGSIYDRNYNIYVNSTSGFATAAYTVSSNSYVYCTSTLACKIGVWNHLAATYDGSTLRLFFNGILNASVASGGSPENASGVSCGTYGSGSVADYFAGKIFAPEVANYAYAPSRILSRWQIAHGIGPSKLYTFGSTSGFVPPFLRNRRAA